MNYRDLGYSDYLSAEPNLPNFIGAPNTLFLEGVDAGQILSLGKIQSPNGKWYIDFNNEEVSLPENSVKTKSVNYQTREHKAVVSKTGGGDFTNIQDAIDYVHRNGGGSIYIKEGVYIITREITMYSNIQLVGAGPGKTEMDFNGRSRGGFKLSGDLTDFSLVITHDPSSFQNVSFENMSFKNTGAYSFPCIDIQYVRNVDIKNCLFDGVYLGVRLTNCISCNIQDSIFVKRLGDPLSAQSQMISVYGSYMNISNNVFSGIADYCVVLENYSGSCNVTSNVFESVRGGVDVRGATGHIFIYDNYFDEITFNSAIHIYNYEESGPTYNVVVSGNILKETAGTHIGIELNGVDTTTVNDQIVVSGNVVSGFLTGIYITNSDNTVVSGNRISGCGTGLSITSTSDRTIYDGNNFIGCTTKVSNSGTNTTAGSNIVA